MKILFVSHDATRTGAPILFLNFIRWFKENSDIPFEILLKSGGELESVFAQLGKCTVYDRESVVLKNKQGYFSNNKLWPFNKQKTQFWERYKDSDFGLIYSNTITNGEILHLLSGLQCKVITHVHELENYIHSCGRDNLDNVIKYTDHYIAPSHAVKDNLILNHGLKSNKIDVIYEFLGEGILGGSNISTSKKDIRAGLSIQSEAFVVGACGTTDWRKSPELFVQLAGYLKRHYPTAPLFFIWVGGSITWELEYDIKKLGLDNIRFVPHTEEFIDYINCMDVFVLTSRIDPCPLVCLEAASLGKPVICFEGAGGMPEFVEEDAGFVVPYLSVESMSEQIMTLLGDRDLLVKLGKQGQRKTKERHDVNVAGAEIVKIIKLIVS